jgi:CelD/BcsL family acetyltransferase involved in cellulose biosynthesis
MRLTCSILEDARALADLAGAWSDLLSRSDADGLVLSPSWLLPWWTIFGPIGGRRLSVAVFREGKAIAGIAPLLGRRHWYSPGIPFRRLELLGSGEPEEDEICSEYIGVIAARGAEEAVADALAERLCEGAFGAWDELVLPAMDGGARLPHLIAGALGRAGVLVRMEATSVAPYATLPSTWEAYLGAMTSHGRHFINRSLRDFDRWAGGDVAVRRASTPAELDEGKRVLVALHQDRWADQGAFGSSRFKAFHDAVMPALLADGALDLLWLEARGEPVACLYNLRRGDKIYVYQSGRRTDLPNAIRPGIVLHARAIRRAIEEGVREYDFLAGDSRYKRRLASASRPIVRLRAVRGRLLEAARVGAGALAAAARRGRAAWSRSDAPAPEAPAADEAIGKAAE